MPEIFTLPSAPQRTGLQSLLRSRRTSRSFADSPLAALDAADALWACSGTTEHGRVCPSARATYPIEVTLIAGLVTDLRAGAYHYDPRGHALHEGRIGDHREAIAHATLDAADWLTACPALLLLSADMAAAGSRFPDQPPEHGAQFVWIEVGLAAQNVYLWAAEHRFGAVLIAGLDDALAEGACRPLVPFGHHVLGVIGIGHTAQ